MLSFFREQQIQCGRSGMRETELVGEEVGETARDQLLQSFLLCLESKKFLFCHPSNKYLTGSFHVQHKVLGSILGYVSLGL